MLKENVPSRSQGREEKMRAASFFAFLPPIVKRLLMPLVDREMPPAPIVPFLLNVLRLEAV